MPIATNVVLFHTRVKTPSDRFNKQNPTYETQIRVNSLDKKKQLEELGLVMKLMIHKEGDQEGEPMLDAEGQKQWRCNLQKRSKKQDGSPAPGVEVKDMKMNDMEKGNIGNGTVANVRFMLREYEQGGEKKTAAVLQGLQIIKLIVYESNFEEESFTEMEGETEIVEQTEEQHTSGAPDAPTVADPEGRF